MASLGQRTPSDTNGGAAAATIPVENPATGEIISTIPVLGEPELERMVQRARAARHGWEAMGLAGRGRVLRRAQRWMLDNPERILDVVVSETGKTYEDAQLADLGYTVTALGFWAKEAAGYLADERVPSWNNPLAALIGKVNCVMFTGSTPTCKRVLKEAAEALVPCYLELGGKDPMIVCADANLDRAANVAAFYSMNNAGQVCISVERVYVEAPVYDQFVDKVADNVRKLRQGAPDGVGSVDVGAVIFPPQLDIVDDHVRDAMAKGARVLTGAGRPVGFGALAGRPCADAGH